MAKRTGCIIQQDKPLMVAMADGTKISSTMICKKLTWSMQGKEFKADMRLIPLGGCDMVLGIQWLAQLGPILWDFKNLRMKFSWNGKKMVLCGATKGPMKLVSALQIEKDLHAPTMATTQIFSMQLEATYVKNKETIIEEMPYE